MLTIVAYLYKPNALLAIPSGALALLCVSAHRRRLHALDRALASELIRDAHSRVTEKGEASPYTVHYRYEVIHKTLEEWRNDDEGIAPVEITAHLERRLPNYDWDTRV